MSNKNYTVYIHISPSSKRYIGITCFKNINQRWRNGKGYSHNIYFTNAINKYGWENIEHIIVAKGLTEDEAKWLEIELIKIWDTTNRDKGYNISLGGDIVSEETRKKISENNPKYWLNSGENHPWCGRHHTEETKQKMKENHADMSGKNNPMFGKDWRNGKTDEELEKIKEKQREINKGSNNPNAKAVICITTMKIFDTVKEAAEYYGIKYPSSISQCLNGATKSSGRLADGTKLLWKYLVDYLEEQNNNNNNN